MITTKMQPRIELNLLGSEGSPFFLIGTAQNIARQLGWSGNQIKTLIEEMVSGDYDNLVKVMQRDLGQYVIIYQ
jgi:hypothetical protein